MELTVKDVIKALQKVDENKIVYIEAGFGSPDIHVAFDVVQLENNTVIIKGDGTCGCDDRDGTEFDPSYKETSFIYTKG